MNLNKKLNQWLEADLIDHTTLVRIKDFEKSNRQPLMLYAISGIGALSLCLGLISIIAANWHHISSTVKICLDLLLGFGLCGYLAVNFATLPKWIKETFIALICGWTLASIALIGQIYQLGGDGKSAITLWTVLILPLILQGRSTLSGVVFLGSLVASYGLWADHLNAVHMLTVLPSLAFAVLGLRLYEPIYQKRPEIISVFSFFALTSTLLVASFTSIMFYTNYVPTKEIRYIYEALILCLPSTYFIWRLVKDKAKSLQIALFASLFCSFVPLLIPHKGGLDFLAIMFFLGYWSIVAKAALDLGQVFLFRLATFVVALRLVITYFELVGTLLDTGLLFISGGALVLFVTRFWYQKQQEILDETRSLPASDQHAPKIVEPFDKASVSSLNHQTDELQKHNQADGDTTTKSTIDEEPKESKL